MNISNEIKGQQQKLWNKFSTGWKKWDNFVINWMRPIGDRQLENIHLKNGETILDVATGTGEPGLTAAKLIPQGKVIGIDLAEEMVRIANEHAKDQGINNYSAKIEDLSQKLTFPSNYFDNVVCRFGIMFFPDPTNDFKEVLRVLKPGGNITFAAWAEPAKNPWATTASSVINKLLNLPIPSPNTPGIFRHSAPGVLQQIFKDTNLKNIKDEEVTGNLAFDSSESYWEFVNDVVAPVAIALSQADENIRQKAKENILKECEHFKRADGKIIFPWSTWVCSAVKQ